MDESTHKLYFKPFNIKDFVINFRKAIPRETFDKRLSLLNWAQKVKNYVYSFPGEPGKEFKYIQN